MKQFLNKIKMLIAPPAKKGQPLWVSTNDNIARELNTFATTFRIGIVSNYINQERHDIILKYKKELDILGYETEVLLYINEKEVPRTVFLPSFTLKDINKNGVPYNPRIDRFLKKKFDMLFNLFFEPEQNVMYIAEHSVAKCRYGAYRPELKSASDVFVYTEDENDINKLIEKINEVLKKQAYERKNV
jgi:hypothetical protein